eukprot:355986-Chlamydomonas_euryale.AAC.22
MRGRQGAGAACGRIDHASVHPFVCPSMNPSTHRSIHSRQAKGWRHRPGLWGRQEAEHAEVGRGCLVMAGWSCDGRMV